MVSLCTCHDHYQYRFIYLVKESAYKWRLNIQAEHFTTRNIVLIQCFSTTWFYVQFLKSNKVQLLCLHRFIIATTTHIVKMNKSTTIHHSVLLNMETVHLVQRTYKDEHDACFILTRICGLDTLTL